MRLPLPIIAMITILAWSGAVAAQPYHTLLVCPDDPQHRAGAERVAAFIEAAGHFARASCGGELRECSVTIMVSERDVVGPIAREFVEREHLHFTRARY